jgi:hypothetical protein
VTATLRLAIACALLTLVACDNATAPSVNTAGPGTGPDIGDGLLTGKTVDATVNGVPFNPSVMTSGFVGGSVGFSASDGRRTFLLNAVNVTSLGTFSLGPGNANNAFAQWIDGVSASYSSRSLGGSGTVTFSILLPGRVAGSVNTVMANTAVSGAQTIRFVGTFDIASP